MKKYISLLAMALLPALAFVSCSVETDEPAGGTKVEKMAGHWVVTVDATAGGDFYEDPYGLGEWDLFTYNTAADDADQMWIDDGGNFWKFKFKCPVNLSAKTFACDGVDYDNVPTGTATITNGKILDKAGKNVNGMPTDSIYFDVEFSDDPGTIYHIHGVRYAGF